MKIIHTADWHIGKKLYNYDLHRDFELFIDWLHTYIQDHKIDCLLVSGDIFDLANPSSESRRIYFETLVKLSSTKVKIILTGGNHDSPAQLNAPKDLLKAMNIHVIGCMTDCDDDIVVPIDKNGSTKAIVAAVPYLRDADIRKAVLGESYEDKQAAIRKGIDFTFKGLSEVIRKNHRDIPIIAMGHLFTARAKTSESERDIQIGNLAAYDSAGFNDIFDYVALGHIHRPQRIDTNVYYSGSPLPLSFSELDDKKRIMVLEVVDGEIHPQSVELPRFRKLIRIKGSLEHIAAKLSSLPEHTGLTHLIEAHLEEEKNSAEKRSQFENLISDFKLPGYEIVKHFIHFSDSENTRITQQVTTEYLEDMKPTEVFKSMLANYDDNEELQSELLEAFTLIYEEVIHEDS